MFFFISPNYKNTPCVKKVAELASDRGYKVVYPEIVWDKSSHAGECGLVFGEQAFCEYVAQEMEWVLYQNSIKYLADLSFTYVKRAVKIDTLQNIKKYDATWQSNVPYKKELRPADDDALFDGGIYNEYPKDINEQSLIVRWIAQNWEHKYRYLVINGKIVDGYKSQHFHLHNHIGYTKILSNVKDSEGKTSQVFLDDFLSRHDCAPSCIFEIGMIERSGWAIVDTFPVWNTLPMFFETEKFLAGLMASTVLSRNRRNAQAY